MTMLTYSRSSADKSRRNDTTASIRSTLPLSSSASVSNPHSTSNRSIAARNGAASKGATPNSTLQPNLSIKQTRDMIEEGYEDLGHGGDESRRTTLGSNRNLNGMGINGHGSGNGTSISNGSNSSSLSKSGTSTTHPRPTRSHSQSQGQSHNHSTTNATAGGGGSTSSALDPDASFKAGLKLIQQAYEDRHQVLVDEVNRWKWISEEQNIQLTAMAAQLARVEDNYAALQREMSQLETFRKAIVSMVDQHSGVTLTELEQSILETIEADGENAEAGLAPAADVDTSSFMLDDDADGADTLSPLGVHQARYTGGDHHSSHAPRKNSASLFTSNRDSTSTRPRASTETLTKSNKDMSNDIRHQSMTGRGRTSSSAHRRDGSNSTTVDSSPNGKKVQKYSSTDSLRTKHNTITSSTRSIYPQTPTTADIKRNSTITPHSPRTQAAASARALGASTSFSSSSTPSTSPRRPSSGSAVVNSGSSLLTRSTRHSHQQKEYSLGVRNSMSHLATVSGVIPLSSGGTAMTGHSDRRQSNTSVNHGLQTPPGQQQSGAFHSGHRAQRSNSGSTAASNLSPAAQELIRQQEQQQLDEQNHVHKGLGQRDTWHGGPSSRGSTTSTFSRSAGHSTTRTSQPPVEEQGYDGDNASSRYHTSGYESSSKQAKDSLATRSRRSTEAQHQADQKQSQDQSQSQGGVDASAFTTLYKEIRDSMDVTSFGRFARVVTAFNEGEKTTDETLQEVGKIVKDRSLNQRFQDLIHQAIAEKENQLEDDVGNATFEGDVTLEVDQSLLLDDVGSNNNEDNDDDQGLDDQQNSILVHDEEDDLQAEQYPYGADDSLLRDHSYMEDLQEAFEQDNNQSLTRHENTSLAAPLRVEDEDGDGDESKSAPAPAHMLRKQTI
ncbi:hypothetical protein EMPS_11232 [Entomortierella parvispora]|uniref:Uncharacterized protein n=1 Tax=Entomortierella parvispora TaxID=205924 RepID=A0A9P3HM52_9FUNG|nr:hypothetical protein EMPS_11232 [Entomortierella parvispora]